MKLAAKLLITLIALALCCNRPPTVTLHAAEATAEAKLESHQQPQPGTWGKKVKAAFAEAGQTVGTTAKEAVSLSGWMLRKLIVAAAATGLTYLAILGMGLLLRRANVLSPDIPLSPGELKTFFGTILPNSIYRFAHSLGTSATAGALAKLQNEQALLAQLGQQVGTSTVNGAANALQKQIPQIGATLVGTAGNYQTATCEIISNIQEPVDAWWGKTNIRGSLRSMFNCSQPSPGSTAQLSLSLTGNPFNK
jgi:hypothetical protein